MRKLMIYFLFVLLLSACSLNNKKESVKDDAQQKKEAAAPLTMEQKWGIEISGIQESANGYMLDFRYKVLDPEKAKPIMDMKIKPYLIDEASGGKMAVPEPPKVGQLRANSQQPRKGAVFYIFFSNPGNFIKKGNKVTIVIGDFKAEHLIVK